MAYSIIEYFCHSNQTKLFFIGFSISPLFYLSLIALYVSLSMYAPRIEKLYKHGVLEDKIIVVEHSHQLGAVLQWQERQQAEVEQVIHKAVDKSYLASLYLKSVCDRVGAVPDMLIASTLKPFLRAIYSRPPPVL